MAQVLSLFGDRRPSPNRQWYDDLMASPDWRGIGEYDHAACPTVLLRRDRRTCLGSFTSRRIWPEVAVEDGFPNNEPTWRSAEDNTLEMPVRFEPAEFLVLDRDTELRFLQS